MTTTKMKTITGRVVGIHEMTRELGGITPQWLQIEIDVDLDDAGAVQTGDTVLVVRASADDDPLAGVQRWTFDAPDGEEWTADDEFIRIEDARAAVARARTPVEVRS